MTTPAGPRDAVSACDGVTRNFPVPFTFREPAFLAVYLLDDPFAEIAGLTPLSEGIDYALAGSGPEGNAQVTTTIAYPVGKYLMRWRQTGLAQETDFVPNDGLDSDALEDELDRLSEVDFELQENFGDLSGRAIRVPRGETVNELPDAAGRMQSLLGFDGAGQPLMFPSAELGSVGVVAQRVEYVASAGQTMFATAATYTVGYLSVYVNGVRLSAMEFTATDGSVAVLNEPVAEGDVVALEGFLGSAVAEEAGAVLFSHLDTYQPGTVGDRLKAFVVVTDHPFLAKGDGVADDRPPIQAALDYVGANGGGGTVYLPQGRDFRITDGLKVPSYVALQGSAPQGYPYNASNPKNSRLIADFADPMQWVVEPKTTLGGVPVPYNVELSGLPRVGPLLDEIQALTGGGATFNCAVRDLLITAKNTVPYGGVRMHGCPGSIVDYVSIEGCGCGLWVNMSFCGFYRVNTITKYYGVACWGQTNANEFKVHCTQDAAGASVVPANYLLPFMAALNGVAVPTYGFHANSHYNSPWMVPMGSSAGSSSVNNRWDITAEHVAGGAVFALFAYATTIKGFYVEGPAITYALAMANSRINSQSFHAFMHAAAHIFDFGYGSAADICVNGIVTGADFFGPINEPGSNVVLRNFAPGGPGTAAHINQPNLKYPDIDGPWIPLVPNAPAVAAVDPHPPFAYRITRSGEVQLQGYLSSLPTASFLAATLPPGFRSANTLYMISDGGSWAVAGGGQLTWTGPGTASSLAPVRYPQAL